MFGFHLRRAGSSPRESNSSDQFAFWAVSWTLKMISSKKSILIFINKIKGNKLCYACMELTCQGIGWVARRQCRRRHRPADARGGSGWWCWALCSSYQGLQQCGTRPQKASQSPETVPLPTNGTNEIPLRFVLELFWSS